VIVGDDFPQLFQRSLLCAAASRALYILHLPCFMAGGGDLLDPRLSGGSISNRSEWQLQDRPIIVENLNSDVVLVGNSYSDIVPAGNAK